MEAVEAPFQDLDLWRTAVAGLGIEALLYPAVSAQEPRSGASKHGDRQDQLMEP